MKAIPKQHLANSLISRLAQTDIALIQIQQGDYNPNNGDVVTYETPYPKKAYVSSFQMSHVAEGVVNIDDLSMLIASDGELPTAEWEVEFQGVRMKIINVFDVIILENRPVTYTLQVRK